MAESLRFTLTVLNSNRPLAEILEFIADQTLDLLACEGAAYYRLNPDDGLLTIQASRGLEENYVAGIAVPLGAGITGRAAKDRKPITINDLHEDEIDPTLISVEGELRELQVYGFSGRSTQLPVPGMME